MRHRLALLAAAVLAAGALAACTGDGPTQSAVELTVWVERVEMPGAQAAAERYEEATGHRVNLIETDGDAVRADFAEQAGRGDGPDIVSGKHDWLGQFLAEDVVSPVDLGAAAASFTPITVTAFTRDGQVYGVPTAFSNIALIRNADLAPEAPATWAAAVEMAAAAEAAYPVLIQTGDSGDPYTYYPFQASFEAPVFTQNPDGTYTDRLGMGGPGGEAFAAWLAEEGAVRHLDFNITYDIAVSQFVQGRSPFVVIG
ncbi:MAG: extracellular solute-binding protein, partial [Propionibacteriaceae bacterium]|nr:extracellular solute-binding protein [Propionibacteriaceae bacterium]